MNLHGSYTSPYVRHCRIALAEESLDFQFVPTDFTQSGQQSPTKRVPFMQDGELFLCDSSAILTHIRAKAGKGFLTDAADADRYFMASTALDTGINLFLLEKDGLTNSPYIDRQKARMQTTFQALENGMAAWDGNLNDGFLRLACLLTWVTFRNRFDFSSFKKLSAFDSEVSQNALLKETMPPQS